MQNLVPIRDRAQSTTNPEISLVAYNIIALLIGPPARAPMTLNVCHMGEGIWTRAGYRAQGRPL